MVKWKGINGSIFHFDIFCKTFQNYPSPVTPSLFPMIWLDYIDVLARLLRKGDGLILSIFHFPILSHFGAVIHHSIHLSVFLSSYMNNKLTHISVTHLVVVRHPVCCTIF